jgi:hypothetical protein
MTFSQSPCWLKASAVSASKYLWLFTSRHRITSHKTSVFSNPVFVNEPSSGLGVFHLNFSACCPKGLNLHLKCYFLIKVNWNYVNIWVFLKIFMRKTHTTIYSPLNFLRRNQTECKGLKLWYRWIRPTKSLSFRVTIFSASLTWIYDPPTCNVILSAILYTKSGILYHNSLLFDCRMTLMHTHTTLRLVTSAKTRWENARNFMKTIVL